MVTTCSLVNPQPPGDVKSGRRARDDCPAGSRRLHQFSSLSFSLWCTLLQSCYAGRRDYGRDLGLSPGESQGAHRPPGGASYTIRGDARKVGVGVAWCPVGPRMVNCRSSDSSTLALVETGFDTSSGLRTPLPRCAVPRGCFSLRRILVAFRGSIQHGLLGTVRISMPTWALPSVQLLYAHADLVGSFSEGGQWLDKVCIDQQTCMDLSFL